MIKSFVGDSGGASGEGILRAADAPMPDFLNVPAGGSGSRTQPLPTCRPGMKASCRNILVAALLGTDGT